MNELVNELIDPRFSNALDRLFRAMEIAEEEITKAQERWPEKRKEIWDMFKYLGLGTCTIPEGYADQVYRAHCQEILERVVGGEDLRPGTDAECMVALCEMSQVAPLCFPAVCLYRKLFERRLRYDPSPEVASFEEWTGSSELESELRKRLARERDCQKAEGRSR